MASQSRLHRINQAWATRRWRFTALTLMLLFSLAGCGQPQTTLSLPTVPATSIAPSTSTPTVASPLQAALNQPFTLRGGAQAMVDTGLASGDLLLIQFVSVRSDTRCPTTVQCAEAGDAVVEITAQLGDQPPATLELHTTPLLQQIPTAYGRYPMQLLALEPERQDRDEVLDLTAYTAQILIGALPPTPTPTPAVITMPGRRPSLGEQFSLQGGQSAFVDTPDDQRDTKLVLHFNGVASDTRCPRLVNCAVAGDAEVVLMAAIGSLSDSFTLHTSVSQEANHISFAGYTIKLVELEPLRDRPEDRIELSQYIAHLIVTASQSPDAPGPTPAPTAQAAPRVRINACSFLNPEMAAGMFGEIQTPGQPQPMPNYNGQACEIQTERGVLTIRFLMGDAATADALIAELQQSGVPLEAPVETPLERVAYGQDSKQAMLVSQRDEAIFAFGITFSDQAQPGDHEKARFNLEQLQTMALVRYAAGQTEELP
jgi:hypothetical protein